MVAGTGREGRGAGRKSGVEGDEEEEDGHVVGVVAVSARSGWFLARKGTSTGEGVEIEEAFVSLSWPSAATSKSARRPCTFPFPPALSLLVVVLADAAARYAECWAKSSSCRRSNPARPMAARAWSLVCMLDRPLPRSSRSRIPTCFESQGSYFGVMTHSLTPKTALGFRTRQTSE
jgi:hypothetical protein